jgi:hypothetical protein
VGQHSSACGPVLLGLHGFQVVSAELAGGERQLAVQTVATVVGCGGYGCGLPARPHRPGVRPADRRPAGGPIVAQTAVALSGTGLAGADLDRAGGAIRPGRC